MGEQLLPHCLPIAQPLHSNGVTRGNQSINQYNQSIQSRQSNLSSSSSSSPLPLTEKTEKGNDGGNDGGDDDDDRKKDFQWLSELARKNGIKDSLNDSVAGTLTSHYTHDEIEKAFDKAGKHGAEHFSYVLMVLQNDRNGVPKQVNAQQYTQRDISRQQADELQQKMMDEALSDDGWEFPTEASTGKTADKKDTTPEFMKDDYVPKSIFELEKIRQEKERIKAEQEEEERKHRWDFLPDSFV